MNTNWHVTCVQSFLLIPYMYLTLPRTSGLSKIVNNYGRRVRQGRRYLQKYSIVWYENRKHITNLVMYQCQNIFWNNPYEIGIALGISLRDFTSSIKYLHITWTFFILSHERNQIVTMNVLTKWNTK